MTEGPDPTGRTPIPPASDGGRVAVEERWRANGHRGGVVWLTGLPGSGKTTLAFALERRLFDGGYRAAVIDGDDLRQGLSADLGFLPRDRAENIRRAGEVAALMARQGTIAIAAFVSPYRSDRERARAAAGSGFHEVYLSAPLAVCEARDPKGHYRRARRGEIADFTGVSAPYEPPEAPDLVLDTAGLGVAECLERLYRCVARHFAVPVAPHMPSARL